MDNENVKTRNLSVEFLMKDYKKPANAYGRLFFDMGSQRQNDQCNVKWKSDLIHSLLQGYKVPEVHIVKNGTATIKPMAVMDGCQRITSIRQYVLGIYALAKTTMPVIIKEKKLDEWGDYVRDENGNPIVVETKYDIAGKKFEQLDKELQERLMSAEIQAVMYIDLTDEEVSVQMERLNRQKAFNGVQRAKVIIGEKVALAVRNITNSIFFDKFVKPNLSKTKEKIGEPEKIVLQSLIVYSADTKALALGAKNIETFAQTNRQNEKSLLMNLAKIKEIFDNLTKLLPDYNVVEKYMTVIHIPILVFNYDKYEQMKEDEEIIEEEYKDFLRYWFMAGIEKSSYQQYVNTSHRMNKINVEGRLNTMAEALDNFLCREITTIPK